MRNEFNLLIGEKNAEEIKLEYSKVRDKKITTPFELKIRGRDLISGLPKEIPVTSEQISKFLERSVKSIVDGVKTTLEITPPELIADIYISAQTAVRNSKRFKTEPAKELYLYVIHGLLHIAGYDDHKTDDIKEMRSKEEYYLKYLWR